MVRCRQCNKLLTEPYYGSGIFCSKKCHNKWVARNRSDRKSNHKSLSEALDNLSGLVSNNPLINHRELCDNSFISIGVIIRCNPIRIFRYSSYSDDIKKHIIRRFINQSDVINSIRSLHRFYGNLPGVFDNFVRYGVKNFSIIRDSFISLYDRYNTWDISNIFKVNQTTIRRLYGPSGLNIASRSMRCSKIHLQMKPMIEEILGVKTETEHFINPYWIDEFSEDLKLCIEIDGAWCHGKDHDRRKDEYLNSLGYSVVRIPAYSSYDKVKLLLSSYSS